MFWTLNGTSPGKGLLNAPGPRTAGANEPLKTSIEFCAVLAAYRSGVPPTLLIARPVYTAPGVVTLICAVVPALAFHAEIVPFKLAKMNEAGALPTGNAGVLL